MKKNKASPEIAIVMGSDSDHPTMKAAAEALTELGIQSEMAVVSAHRTPQEVADFAQELATRHPCHYRGSGRSGPFAWNDRSLYRTSGHWSPGADWPASRTRRAFVDRPNA